MEAIVGAIGFLGAAAIIQGRFELFGATTGASIWVVGAIGMACGFGFYAMAVAVTVAGRVRDHGAGHDHRGGRRDHGTAACKPDEPGTPATLRRENGMIEHRVAGRACPCVLALARRLGARGRGASGNAPAASGRAGRGQARPKRIRRRRQPSCPQPSTTRHEIEIGGRRIDYRATAGTLPVGQDPERPEAHLFYVAYAMEQADPDAAGRLRAERRPGRSGRVPSSRRARAAAGRARGRRRGAPPPARVVPNPDTWLDVHRPRVHRSGRDRLQPHRGRRTASAMTGRLLGTSPIWRRSPRSSSAGSAATNAGSRRSSWSARATAAFASRRSPDFSTSGQGIQVNGAVLISPVLEFSLHDGDDYTLLPWVLRVPSFAAVAHRTAKARPPPRDGGSGARPRPGRGVQPRRAAAGARPRRRPGGAGGRGALPATGGHGGLAARTGAPACGTDSARGVRQGAAAGGSPGGQPVRRVLDRDRPGAGPGPPRAGTAG